MSHIRIDEGTVVVPFINIEAARAVYSANRERRSVFGLPLSDGINEVLFHEEQEARRFTVTTGNGEKEVAIKPAYVIVPVSGTITDAFYRLRDMAKIPGMSPDEVLRSLQNQETLQSLERDRTSPEWPSYCPGRFNK
jgi:hypothetical protein